MTEQAEKRRGPRSDVDVRELILDVTEAMAGDTNPDAVSLRAIAREANVAPRALSYHFANKRSLLEAVLRRRSGAISESIMERMVPLRDRQGPISIRDVVESLILPLVELIEREPLAGVRWMRIYLTLSSTEDPSWGIDPDVAHLFFELAERALGTVDDGARRRVALGLLGMLETLSRVDQVSYGQPLRGSQLDPDFVDQLVIFTSAGIAGLKRKGTQ